MISYDFKGKTAIVTGASRGIGAAIARSLLECDAHVIITSRKTDNGWWSDYPQCVHRALDFSDPKALKDFSAEILDGPQVDILVNNAAVLKNMFIDELNLEDWEEMHQVNVTAPAMLMQAVSKLMLRAGSGKILNVSSIADIITRPGSTAYAATKSGLIGLTKAAAVRLAPSGILVNALCPGYTDTDMTAGAVTDEQRQTLIGSVPLNRLAHVDEIAGTALFLVSELNTYITGQKIIVDGGVTIQ